MRERQVEGDASWECHRCRGQGRRVCVWMLRRCQGLCWVVIQVLAGFWEAGWLDGLLGGVLLRTWGQN